MEQPVLDLLMQRFERLEKQNDDQLDLLRAHLDKDGAYYTKVDRHDLYFKGVWTMFAAGIPAVWAYITTKLGVK